MQQHSFNSDLCLFRGCYLSNRSNKIKLIKTQHSERLAANQIQYEVCVCLC